jgi:LmbE family N-acetylglucosaminyl deacetylase
MCLSAHPDDEDGTTLAYYSRLRGVKTYSLFFTRGEGGQNEIGSELYEDLGAIRTNETLEAANILGSEVYFLGFPDFGFSKTARETFSKWGGKDSVLSRLVYYIRALKPDVIITNHDTVTIKPNRQHGNHQAVGITAYEAFRKAADPLYHPEQLSGEVTVWQVKKLFVRGFRGDTTGQGNRAVVSIDGSARDSSGQAIEELGLEALRKHRSQGLEKVMLSAIPDFFRRHRYLLIRSDRVYPLDPHDLFSGIGVSPKTRPPLPKPVSEIPEFSVRASPQYVAKGRTARLVVTIMNRTGKKLTAALSVLTGGSVILTRHYVSTDRTSDTLTIAGTPSAGAFGSTLVFRAAASAEGRSYSSESTVRRKSVAARVAPNALVGLIKTYDDTNEETLRSFGIRYRLLDSALIATGDLDSFSVIILDLRAYEYRRDASLFNNRLLEYVHSGGNLVCFYHKTADWNGKSYSPFPIALTNERVTQEDAPVAELLPSHLLLTSPNAMTPGDWNGWVQERSIYLPDQDTSKTSAAYERLLAMSDEGEQQPPTSMLWARYGNGSYTYISLALYRQLRILQGGAVKLFFNLISQPRH